MILAPKSPAGFTVVHVIPSDWGPFVDVRAMFLSKARRHPWVFVLTPDEFRARQNDWLWDDPATVFVLWVLVDPGPLYLRKCRVVHVYAEAMDPNEQNLLVDHRVHWEIFRTMSVHFDAVLTHTPWTRDHVAQHVKCPVFVFPVGWDAEAMGLPRWDAPKYDKLCYHGSLVGRREILVPYLRQAWGNDLVYNVGVYGRALLGRLDTSRVSLYVQHSNVHSFSTWRIWQMVSTSCALVAEVGTDTWPFVAGEHFFPITWFSLDNNAALAELVAIVEDQTRQLEVARTAHEIGCKFTVDYVEREYLDPALERMNAHDLQDSSVQSSDERPG